MTSLMVVKAPTFLTIDRSARIATSAVVAVGLIRKDERMVIRDMKEVAAHRLVAAVDALVAHRLMRTVPNGLQGSVAALSQP